MRRRIATNCPKCNSLQPLTPKVRFHGEMPGFVERYACCGMCGEEVILDTMHVEEYRQMNQDARRARRMARAIRRKNTRP